MTTARRYEPDFAVAVEELRLPAELAQPAVVEVRRAALAALDPMVQRLLPRFGLVLFPSQSLTIYDAVYAGTPEIGGHWMVASRSLGFFGHTIAGYSVALAFDAENRPHHFIITGAAESLTCDTSEASLAEAIDAARRTGPLVTSAPHLFSSIGL